MRISDWSSDVCSSDLPASAGDADAIFEAALEAGADDVSSNEDEHEIWTAMDALHEVARALEAKLGPAEGAKLAWKPQTTVEVDESNAATLMTLVDTLEDDDDVQTVWGNSEVSDEVMRSDEPTSELQSLLSTTYAVFC